MNPMKGGHIVRMMVTITVDAIVFVQTYGDAILLIRREKAAELVL